MYILSLKKVATMACLITAMLAFYSPIASANQCNSKSKEDCHGWITQYGDKCLENNRCMKGVKSCEFTCGWQGGGEHWECHKLDLSPTWGPVKCHY